jgi:hypothetical protein
VAALVAAAAIAAVTAVVWLASALYGLVAAAAADGRNTGAASVRWSAAGRLTRVITDPVHAYLTSHAAALHTSGHLLWLGWLATIAVLFILAVLGSTSARIGPPRTAAAGLHGSHQLRELPPVRLRLGTPHRRRGCWPRSARHTVYLRGGSRRMTLTVLDGYCGAGGSSSGAEMVPGVRVRYALNHWDKVHRHSQPQHATRRPRPGRHDRRDRR